MSNFERGRANVPSIKWANVWERAVESGCVFNLFIGGRGIGKTYGALLEHYRAFTSGRSGKMIYMRLSGTELDGAATTEENPYKRINRDQGLSIEFLPEKKHYIIAETERDEEGKLVSSNSIGTGRSLASFHNLRGVDFSDYDIIYLDEFIPTENVRKTPEIKQAGYLFGHAYETANRNRELLGEDPIKVIMTANSFSLDSDILRAFDLIKVLQRMIKTGQRRYTDRERSIYLELMDSEVSAAKRDTAIYKAMRGTAFGSIALDNKFNDYALTLIKAVNFNEYNPVVKICGIIIFKHKSSGELYAATKSGDAPTRFTGESIKAFRRIYRSTIMSAIELRAIYFDSADTYLQLQSYISR